MSEQQSPQPTENAGLSDQQLIDGDALVENATNSFMDSTFQIDPSTTPPVEQKTEDAFTPSSEVEEGNRSEAKPSADLVEMERRAADLRRRERELEEHYEYLDSMAEKPPSFREAPWEAFQHMLRQYEGEGVDPTEALERMTANILNQDTEQLERERHESRYEQMQGRIEELQNQMQSQAYEAEEAELYAGLGDMLEDSVKQWPLAASRGADSVGEVFDYILQVHEETGEVLDAAEVFQQLEDGLHQQIESLKSNDVIRQMLGLSAQQMNQPQHVSAREVVQGTPTLTNQSAGERSVLSSVDDLPDEDEMIRLASEAFLGG